MLARKTLLIIANNVAGGILGYIILFVIARYMINADYIYGVVAFGLATLGLFMFILNPGTNTAHIKKVSEGKDVGTCIGTYLAMKVVLTAFFLIVILVGMFTWKHIFNQGFESTKIEVAIYILLINYVLTSFNGVFVATYEARKEIAKAQLGMLMSTLSRLAAVLIIVYFQMGVYGLAWTWNISMMAYFLVSILMFRGYRIKRPSWELAKDYIKFAFPIMFITIASVLVVTTDRVMLGYFWNPEDVGHYFAAWRITVFIIMFGVAVQKLVFPTISEYHTENKKGLIQNLSWVAEKYIGLFIIPICFFMAVFPSDVIHIMTSDDFLPAAPILRIFAIYSLLIALNIPYASQFAGTNRPRMAALLGIPAAILNILLNLILVPASLFGIPLAGLKGVGAALGTLISTTIYVVVSRIVIYKSISGTKSNWKIIFNLISAGLMSLFLYYILYQYHPIVRYYDIFLYMGVGAVIYFAAMFIFRQFTKKEFVYLLKVVDPVQMLKYIKKEVFARKKQGTDREKGV
ncbi:MAG: flippase [Candidatus Thermoplasmatota archaeon]|nr:flippase [Candidatus Thermoplasmatota archaeon]MDP7266242.1 flippase [Candidatus Thermoplasmatota archaeon]